MVGRVPASCEVSKLWVATPPSRTATCRLGKDAAWGEKWDLLIRHGHFMVGKTDWFRPAAIRLLLCSR